MASKRLSSKTSLTQLAAAENMPPSHQPELMEPEAVSKNASSSEANVSSKEDEDDEPVVVKSNNLKRKRARVLSGLESQNVIHISDEDDDNAGRPPAATQHGHVTRAARNGRRQAGVYDMRYHPMDSSLRPKWAAKRGHIADVGEGEGENEDEDDALDDNEDEETSGPDELELPSGSDSEEPASEPPQKSRQRATSSVPIRRSGRASTKKPVVYNAKVHPQDAQLPTGNDSEADSEEPDQPPVRRYREGLDVYNLAPGKRYFVHDHVARYMSDDTSGTESDEPASQVFSGTAAFDNGGADQDTLITGHDSPPTTARSTYGTFPTSPMPVQSDTAKVASADTLTCGSKVLVRSPSASVSSRIRSLLAATHEGHGQSDQRTNPAAPAETTTAGAAVAEAGRTLKEQESVITRGPEHSPKLSRDEIRQQTDQVVAQASRLRANNKPKSAKKKQKPFSILEEPQETQRASNSSFKRPESLTDLDYPKENPYRISRNSSHGSVASIVDIAEIEDGFPANVRREERELPSSSPPRVRRGIRPSASTDMFRAPVASYVSAAELHNRPLSASGTVKDTHLTESQSAALPDALEESTSSDSSSSDSSPSPSASPAAESSAAANLNQLQSSDEIMNEPAWQLSKWSQLPTTQAYSDDMFQESVGTHATASTAPAASSRSLPTAATDKSSGKAPTHAVKDPKIILKEESQDATQLQDPDKPFESQADFITFDNDDDYIEQDLALIQGMLYPDD